METNRQHIKFLAVSVLVAIVLTGCGGVKKDNGNTAANTQVSPVQMRIVTDDLDRQVTIPVNVKRVVSLAPSLTENIFAVGAGERLAGVTTFCNFPEQAKSLAKVGDTMTPNMESIIALKPDVVFVSTASQIEAFTKTLEQNGIAVYVTNPRRLGDLYKNLEQLGIIFDTNEIARQVVNDLQRREYDVRSRCGTIPIVDGDPPSELIRVFVQISKEPLFTIGKVSFVSEIIYIAGGKSMTANVESAYPKLSKETASALNPDAIILSDSEDNKEPNEVFKNSPAVKNGRVYKVNADLLSRPGPRLVDALEQIAKDLHPEKFK